MATQNLLGSVMNRIFGPATPQTAAPQNPNITNNLQNNPPPPAAPPSQTVAPNGVVPPSGQEDGKSPAADFSKLWEPTPVDPNKKPEDSQALTPQQMLEAAAKVDFAKVIDKETLAKINAGGDGAMEALVSALNKVSQQTYAQSTLVADKLITAQVERAKEEFAKQVPELVKRQRMQDGLIKENPAFKDPAVAPIVNTIQNQFAEKFPGATADELQVMAQKYFIDAASKFAPPKKSAKTGTDGKTTASDEEDWDTWGSA